MANLRKSIVFMILFLAFLFNVERLDYSGQNIINLQSFVYVLITVAILAIIAIHLIQRISVYYAIVFWTAAYFLLKLFLFTDRPILGNIYTYLTITEVALICVSILLAYDLARSLRDFEGVIEKVTFPKHGQRVIPIAEANEEIKTEFIRSRRHNRPLSVMVVEMDPSTTKITLEKTVKNIQHSMLSRYLLASLAQILSKEARRTDLILEQLDQDGFILLCPETTAEGSNVLAERIQTLAQERLGVTVNCGFAAFPDEALTFEELLQKAAFNIIGPEKLAAYPYSETEDMQVESRNEG